MKMLADSTQTENYINEGKYCFSNITQTLKIALCQENMKYIVMAIF